jgi:hypothetical protein
MLDVALSRDVGMLVRAEQKACWRNAVLGLATLVNDHPQAVYVEGYVLTDIGLPMEHGWIELPDERVVDPTIHCTPHLALIRGYYPGKRFSYSDVMKHLRRRQRHLPTYAQDSRRWTADHQRGMEAAYMELGMTEDQLDLFFPHRSKIYEQEASDG